jgi:5'-3' exonuclease
MIDYLALVGDSIDDIPGVPGLGPKTAQGLLGHFGDIDQLFKRLHQVVGLPIRGASKLSEKLLQFQSQIAIAQQLAKITDDIDLGVTRRDLEWSPTYIDNRQVQDFCQRMGFPRLFTRIEKVIG